MGNSYTSLSTQEQDDFIKQQRLARARRSASGTIVDRNCVVRRPVHQDAVTALAAVRPGMVISGGRDALLALNNIDTGECVLKWTGHEKEITKVMYRYASGKHLLVSGSRDATVKLWQFNSPKTLNTFRGHELTIMGLELLNDNTICSGSRDNTIRTWDVTTGKCIMNKSHSRNLVTHMACSKSGDILAQTSEDKELKLWDARDLSLIHQFPKKRHIQMHCDVLPDGLYCLSCSNGFNGDGCEISLWDLRQRKLLREFKGHDESVHCAIYLPQQVTWKRLILSVSADHSARIWSIDDGNCLWSEYIPSGGDLLSCVGFNDGSVVACGLNSCLCSMRLMGKAGKPFLHSISMQVQPCHSQSSHLL